MANPFEPIEYATIVGRFMVASTDSDDLGDEPDMVAATGKGRFLPSVSHILVAGATPPATIKLAPVDFEFDEQGYISNPITKERGVRVVAPTDAVNPTGFTYRVTFDTGTSFLGFDFSVPAGGTVDLTRVGRVARDGGVPITRGEPGVGVAAIVLADDEASLQITYDNGLVRVVPVPALDEARVARDEAVEAATNAVAPTQAAIAQALVDPDSEARAALNATYGSKAKVEALETQKLDKAEADSTFARAVDVFDGGSLKFAEHTFDPAQNPSRDGTLLLILKAPPTRFYTDFSQDTVGQAPSGWTPRWELVDTIAIVAEATADNGVAMSLSGGSGGGGINRAITWDDIAPATDAEVVVKWKSTVANDGVKGLVRASETLPPSGYHGGVFNSTAIGGGAVGLHKLVNSTSNVELGISAFPTSTSTWYITRTRAEGNTISTKTWSAATAEPQAWDFQVQDNSVPGPGLVGIRSFIRGGTRHIDWVGVGLDGQTAPMQAVTA